MADLIFFFFQAEDGIRDVAVTGVQTCALPISRLSGGLTPETVSRLARGAGSRRWLPAAHRRHRRRWPRHAGDRLGGLAGVGFKRLESTYRKDRVYFARHPARRRRVRRPLPHPARPGPSDDRGRCPKCAIPEEADSRAGLSSAFSLRYRQGLARSRTPSTTRWLPPDPLIAAPARLRPPAGQPSGRIDR